MAIELGRFQAEDPDGRRYTVIGYQLDGGRRYLETAEGYAVNWMGSPRALELLHDPTVSKVPLTIIGDRPLFL